MNDTNWALLRRNLYSKRSMVAGGAVIALLFPPQPNDSILTVHLSASYECKSAFTLQLAQRFYWSTKNSSKAANHLNSDGKNLYSTHCHRRNLMPTLTLHISTFNFLISVSRDAYTRMHSLAFPYNWNWKNLNTLLYCNHEVLCRLRRTKSHINWCN